MQRPLQDLTSTLRLEILGILASRGSMAFLTILYMFQQPVGRFDVQCDSVRAHFLNAFYSERISSPKMTIQSLPKDGQVKLHSLQ